MIITIILAVMLIIGIIFSVIGGKYAKYDFLEPLGVINCALGSICFIVAVITIIVSHDTIPKTIQQNKMEYDGLCKRYEIVTSEYEDVSKSDVIADIIKWNKNVYNTKYWTESPWTNWFNPKEIADNLQYISLEE